MSALNRWNAHFATEPLECPHDGQELGGVSLDGPVWTCLTCKMTQVVAEDELTAALGAIDLPAPTRADRLIPGRLPHGRLDLGISLLDLMRNDFDAAEALISPVHRGIADALAIGNHNAIESLLAWARAAAADRGPSSTGFPRGEVKPMMGAPVGGTHMPASGFVGPAISSIRYDMLDAAR